MEIEIGVEIEFVVDIEFVRETEHFIFLNMLCFTLPRIESSYTSAQFSLQTTAWDNLTCKYCVAQNPPFFPPMHTSNNFNVFFLQTHFFGGKII